MILDQKNFREILFRSNVTISVKPILAQFNIQYISVYSTQGYTIFCGPLHHLDLIRSIHHAHG
jgi:hypothetical protein